MNKELSQYNPIITLEYLKTQKENQYFERKGLGVELIKPSKIAEELVGMLNADGGLLAFGISDAGEIQDLSTLPNLDDYRKLIFDFISPACHIKLEEIKIENSLIFLFHVEQELERIFCHSGNNTYFLRVADSNRKLDLDQIRRLEYDKNIRRFEDEVMQEFDENDLDWDLLNEYKDKLNQADAFELLNARHLIVKKSGKTLFKTAAVLLFSKNPEKYIPTASVRYIRYQGTSAQVGEAHNVIKDQRFENNIPNLVIQVRDFLRVSLNDYYYLDLSAGKFIKLPEYPEAAWLEGIVNAVCHRSYNRQGSSIYIKHFDNRLEISNSGPLPAQVTVENIKHERYARNPRIARVLEDFGYVRQLNEGVKRIYELMKQFTQSEPEYREQNSTIYLTLRNHISTHSRTVHSKLMLSIEQQWQNFNDTQRAILQLLFTQGKADLKHISTYVNINQNTVRGYLNVFVNEGILEKHSKKQRDIHALYAFKQDF